MIYCNIRWDNANQLSILPYENIGKVNFAEFRTKIYEEGSIDRCLDYRDRTTDTITVSSSNLLDGTNTLEYVSYRLFACFKNHRLDTIGLCQSGNTPVNYDYFQEINATIYTTSTASGFLSFEDYMIENNIEMGNSGWVDVEDNSLFVSGYQNKSSTQPVKFRRFRESIQWTGLVQRTAGNLPSSGTENMVNLVPGVRVYENLNFLCYAVDAAVNVQPTNNATGNVLRALYGNSHGTLNSNDLIELNNVIYYINTYQ